VSTPKRFTPTLPRAANVDCNVVSTCRDPGLWWLRSPRTVVVLSTQGMNPLELHGAKAKATPRPGCRAVFRCLKRFSQVQQAFNSAVSGRDRIKLSCFNLSGSRQQPVLAAPAVNGQQPFPSAPGIRPATRPGSDAPNGWSDGIPGEVTARAGKPIRSIGHHSWNSGKSFTNGSQPSPWPAALSSRRA